MSVTAPTLAEIQPLATSLLVAAPYFVAASEGIAKANPGTSDLSVVVMDQGVQDPVIKQHLRVRGFCVAVHPLIAGQLRDQSGSAFLVDVEIPIKVMVNPEVNRDKGKAVDIYQAMIEVCKTLCRATRHPGGEFVRLAKDGDCFELQTFDEGAWAYMLRFRKETQI